ncbi:MAG: SpoIIE family protein phosphatase [Magnetococcales bacterium]|nr:SpoIIE family protein phosphatase [Magnetococcales bacterium]
MGMRWATGNLGFLRGITAKVILILLLSALLPMLSIAYWNLQGSLVRVTRLEEQNLELLAISVAQRLDQWLKDSQLLVDFLAGDPEIIRLLSRSRVQQAHEVESAQQTVLNMGRVNSDVAAAYIMDQQGRFLVSSNPKVVGQLRPELDYFRVAMTGSPFISNLRFGSTSGDAGAYFSKPVRDEAGHVMGVAVIKFLGRVVQTIMEETGNADITPLLVDRDGVIIYHPDPSVRFHSLRPLAPEKIRSLLDTHRFPVATIASLDDIELADHMITARQSGFVRHFAPFWQSHRITGIAPVTRHSWVVGMSEDEVRFTRLLNELLDDTVNSLLLVGGIMLPLSWLMGRRLTHPLAILTRASYWLEKKFSHSDEQDDQGDSEADLQHRLNLEQMAHERDEFGQLCQVFQQMAQEVVHRKEMLDQQVQEKTRQLRQQNDRLALAQRRIDSELSIAKAMQLAILPTDFPLHPHYRLHATMRPALETGGDFYDFFLLDDDRLGVLIADVSGKGVPAALFMAISRTVLQAIAQKGLTAAQCLTEANAVLCAQNPIELFVTLFYGILDSRNGEFRYANGGHNPPYHVTTDGRVTPLTSDGDMALGVMDGISYREYGCTLMPGEQLFLFTDGVTEAFDRDGHPFGEQRLMLVLQPTQARTPRQVVEQVEAELHRFSAGAEQSDDITCLSLVCNSWAQPVSPCDAATAGAEMILQQRLVSLADIPSLADQLTALGQESGVPQEALFPINLSLDEWLTNVLSYGFQAGESPAATVQLYRHADRWTAIVISGGIPYNPLEQQSPDLNASVEQRPIGGLGIHFMREMMDSVEYFWDKGYNYLILVKKLSGE